MTPAEKAARCYIAAWLDPDPAERARLVEQCFAENGRIVLQGKEMRGRATLARMIEDFVVDPRRLKARLVEDVEAQDPLFRFRAAFDHPDGTLFGTLQDFGEIDADGRIATIYTFVDAPRGT